MATQCVTCSGYLQNTGLPSGDKPFGRIVGMYFVPLLADDGTPNYLDLNAPSIDAELLGKINNPDPSKRWYPMLNLNNVAPTQEDAVYETDDAGNRFKIRDGLQTMSYQFWNVSHNYYRQVAAACVNFGIVLIDECGNLLGEYDGTGRIYPRAVNQNSFNGVYTHATATETSKVTINFDYKLTTSDADQYMLGASVFTSVSPLYLNGMVDVNIVTSNPAAGSVNVTISTPFGTINDPIMWLGGNASNITIINHTAATTVTPTTVTNNGNGSYTITFTAQTTGDNLSVSVFAAAAGNNEFGYEGESEIWQEP